METSQRRCLLKAKQHQKGVSGSPNGESRAYHDCAEEERSFKELCRMLHNDVSPPALRRHGPDINNSSITFQAILDSKRDDVCM
jgi:hypothetical protein